jgi:hypothetical protein
MSYPDPETLCLRNLPLPTRLTLAAFLIAVGVGYFAGLIQLHFAHAKGGKILPDAQDAREIYYGSEGKPMSHLERLIANDQGGFNGTGTMKPAFFEKSEKKWAERLAEMPAADKDQLLKEREGERQALLAWIRARPAEKAFDNDDLEFPLPADFRLPLPEDYKAGKDQKLAVKAKKLFTDRCVRCHAPGGADNAAGKFPLDTYEQFVKYNKVQESNAMTLDSLALTTHVHLLGFGMLFGLTGVIFSLTSYPCWVRCLIAPLALVAQTVDIGCWWLGRLDPHFTQVIVVTGSIVAVSLLLQIVLSLFNLFGKAGKAVVLGLMLAAGAVGYQAAVTYVLPFLEAKQKAAAAQK